MGSVEFVTDGPVAVVAIARPEVRNAVDGPTAAALAGAFRRFEADGDLRVAVLTGREGHFCAGADLKALGTDRGNRAAPDGEGPMGPTRMLMAKPVIAAVEGFAVAGGLELALWCDLRIAAENAVFGVFSRRWGVPLIDGGTIRLARTVGQGRALDMILTGRPVGAEEALAMGLATRVVPAGTALDAAVAIANELAAFPQAALRSDRLSTWRQWGLGLDEALAAETEQGMSAIESGEAGAGAARFAGGAGRHGSFGPPERGDRARAPAAAPQTGGRR